MRRSFFAIIASVFIAAVPLGASAQWTVGVGIGFGGPGWGVGVGYAGYAPPPLPVYSMPPAPYPGWQWIPGYWGWGSYGYYWIPGYWTAPPAVGLYWTPGYWGYSNGYYGWNPGYWGPTVGFYGGINYGFGYFGTGFVGGYWSGGVFNYNTAVVNVNRTVITHTFSNRTVVRGHVVGGSRVSFNGGRRGVRARPTPAQLAARRHAVAETRAQRAHERIAARDRGQLAAINHGHPRVAAVQRPFSATHHPAHMHAITAADRRVAQRTMTHHTMSATAHHHMAMRHGTVGAATRHSAFARHGSVSAPVRHSASMSHSTFSARGSSHAGFAGRSGGGFSHAGFSGRMGGGSGRMGGGGGRMGGGGGGGRGRPPRG